MSHDENVDVSAYIEREVQKRLAVVKKQQAEEVENLRNVIDQCKNDLIRQNHVINKMAADPLIFGNLIKVGNATDPRCFKVDDEVIVTNPHSPHFNKGGRIVKHGENLISEEGCVLVHLIDDTQMEFGIGLEGKAPAEIRLTNKDDGTFAVVQVDGKPWEVRGVPDLNLNIGDPVKIRPDNKAIVSKAIDFPAGPIVHVSGIYDDCIEVLHKGEKQLVYNPKNLDLQEGDRIVTDPNMFSVVKKLPQENHKKYRLDYGVNTTWDDVGGLDDAKNQLRFALETPYKHPDLFKQYNVKPLTGALLYGPPGCGKTLLVRVMAWSMAQMHGTQAVESGYMYVKAPELLDMYVGNTEKKIVNLFKDCRQHYRKFGYKAILAVDEADAILATRGLRRSSDVNDTIIPMWLGEMDGANETETIENPIVVFMTNRADVLDQAVVRYGRINAHIKVNRPDEYTAADILKIHSSNTPFQNENEREKNGIFTLTVSDLFSKNRLLYRINNEHDFTLGNCVNGAMLANIAESAKMTALNRDLSTGQFSGVTLEDYRMAVKKVYEQQRGISHKFDLEDYALQLGLQPESIRIERCFGSV